MPVQEHLIADVLTSKTYGKAKASFVCCLCLFAFKLSFSQTNNNKKICIPFPVLLSDLQQAAISSKSQFRDTVYAQPISQLLRRDQTRCSSVVLSTSPL